MDPDPGLALLKMDSYPGLILTESGSWIFLMDPDPGFGLTWTGSGSLIS